MDFLKQRFNWYLLCLCFIAICSTPIHANDSLPQTAPTISAEKWERLQKAIAGGDTTSPATDDNRKEYKRMESGKIMILTIKVMFYLAIIAVALYFVLKTVKKKGGISGASQVAGKNLELIETKQIGANKQIALVRVGNSIIAVGITESSITLLKNLENQEEVAALLSDRLRDDNKMASSFSETVDAFLSRFKKSES